MKLLVLALAMLAPYGAAASCLDPRSTANLGRNVYVNAGDMVLDPSTCIWRTCEDSGNFSDHFGCVFPQGYDSYGQSCAAENYVIDHYCETQQCQFDADADRGVFQKVLWNVPRCSIGGQCYTHNEGPNSCTTCIVDDFKNVEVSGGCMAEDGSCVAEGSVIVERCVEKTCLNGPEGYYLLAGNTVGCFAVDNVNGERTTRCYGQDHYMVELQQCKTCTVYNNVHHWHNSACRSPFIWEPDMCYNKNTEISYKCRQLHCFNYGATGWSRTNPGAPADCWYNESPTDTQPQCLTPGSEKAMSDFCYVCDNSQGGKADVACLICGECVRPGDSRSCDGKTLTCSSSSDENPPGEGTTTCIIGSVSLEEGQSLMIDCTNYTCTHEGAQIVTSDCLYEGQCCQVGTNCTDTCLFCEMGDNGMARLSQECPSGANCVPLGAVMQHTDCKFRMCMQEGDFIRLVAQDGYPVACELQDRCYPEGPMPSPSSLLCMRCGSDGNRHYSCKVNGNECLDVGDIKQDLKCYDRQCQYDQETNSYGLKKLPGQDFRCYLPDGTCLNEDDTKTIGNETYGCHPDDVCIVGGRSLSVGDTTVFSCHDVECVEATQDGVTVRTTDVNSYKCPALGDGDTCYDLGEVVNINCYNYTCKLVTGEKYARLVRTTLTQMCTYNGQCIVSGDSIQTDSGTVSCPPGSGNGEIPLRSGGCRINGVLYEFGETATTTCNEIDCLFQDGKAIINYTDPHCAVKLNQVDYCVPAGQYHPGTCYRCEFDVTLNRPVGVMECKDDLDNCVIHNQMGEYNCNPSSCVSGTWQPMEPKVRCSFNGGCILEGTRETLIYNSTTRINCHCANAISNNINDCRIVE